MVSIFGIALGLFLLIYFAFKGRSMIWAAPICVFAVAILSKMDPVQAYLQDYMKGMVDFVKDWFPVFMLSAILGKVMEYTGSASAISYAISKRLGNKHVIFIVAICGYVLTYGGVNCWVAIFAVFPIAVALFRDADIPRRLMPATITTGTFTSAMTTIAGTPQIHNLIPMKVFGTTPMAAPTIGFTCAIIEFGGALLWLNYRAKKLKASGEHYTEPENHLDIKTYDKLPNPILSLIPLVVLLVLLNQRYYPLDPAICIIVGVILAVIFNFKNIKGNITSVFNTGCMESVKTIMNTASVIGFGSVVKATIGFALLKNLLFSLHGDPLITETISINFLAAASGSASGGLRIAMDTLGATFLKNGIAAGYSPQVLHRIAAMASGCLNSMPHDGGIVTILLCCGITHRDGYFDLFMTNAMAPSFALIIGLIMAMHGIV